MLSRKLFIVLYSLFSHNSPYHLLDTHSPSGQPVNLEHWHLKELNVCFTNLYRDTYGIRSNKINILVFMSNNSD